MKAHCRTVSTSMVLFRVHASRMGRAALFRVEHVNFGIQAAAQVALQSSRSM